MFGNWSAIIPNLELGLTYSFGTNLRQSHWHADYTLPVKTGSSGVVSVEFHADLENISATSWLLALNNFWQHEDPGLQDRIDLSIGGGYRNLFNDRLLLGVNVFFDSTRLTGSWRYSGGLGFEVASFGPGNSLVDMNINFYSLSYIAYDSRGSVLLTFNLLGAISRGKGNFDFEAGYSQPLFYRAFDLRLKATVYQFELANSQKIGFRSEAEITFADGLMRLSIEFGHDGVIGSYTTVGAYLNIGFEPENLFEVSNPFTSPEPILKSPRILKKLLAEKSEEIGKNLPQCLLVQSAKACLVNRIFKCLKTKPAFGQAA